MAAGIRKIYLKKAVYVLVDADDYPYLSLFQWSIKRARNTFYAHRGLCINGKWTTIKMHQQILGTESKKHIDHINGNGLDNRRTNLRFCTEQENQRNRGKQQGTSSQYKGVSWYKSSQKWVAHIGIGGIRKHLGYFVQEIDAANAYDNAAIKYFGSFAKTNKQLKKKAA